MPHNQLEPLAAGDRVQHSNAGVRFGRILKIEGRLAVVKFEDGGEEWVNIHSLICTPSMEDIYGRITKEFHRQNGLHGLELREHPELHC